MAGNPFDREILKWILEAVNKAFGVQASTNVEMASVKMNEQVDKSRIDIAAMMGISSYAHRPSILRGLNAKLTEISNYLKDYSKVQYLHLRTNLNC